MKLNPLVYKRFVEKKNRIVYVLWHVRKWTHVFILIILNLMLYMPPLHTQNIHCELYMPLLHVKFNLAFQ